MGHEDSDGAALYRASKTMKSTPKAASNLGALADPGGEDAAERTSQAGAKPVTYVIFTQHGLEWPSASVTLTRAAT
jgi:hypothetical protein